MQLYLPKKFKILALLSLILLAMTIPVFAGQNYNFGASLVSVPSAMSGVGGALEYVSTPTFKGAEPPLTINHPRGIALGFGGSLTLID